MTRSTARQRFTEAPPLTRDSTGWQWACHLCIDGEEGCFTRWGARRRQRRHLRAHR